MGNNATKEEESGKPSGEEKKEEVGKTSDFEAVGREIQKFKKEEAEKEPSEEPENKPDEKPDEKQEKESAEKSETEEKKLESKEEPGEEKEPEPKYWIVDKDGNKIPLIGKARGKFYNPENPEKALTWINMGIDSGDRNKSIKEREEAIIKKEEALSGYEPFLQALDKADKEGKLYVEDDEGKKIRISDLIDGGERKEEEEEDDVLEDPKIKEMRSRIAKLEETSDKEKKARIDAAIEKAKQKVDGEIEEQRKTLPGIYDKDDESSPKDIWDILEENKDMTVEEAAKLSHESEVNFIKKRIEKNPDLYIDRDAIYADKIAEKNKKEEAPVESPSEMPAGTPGQEEKKDKFKDMSYSEIIKEGFKDIDASHKSAEKS